MVFATRIFYRMGILVLVLTACVATPERVAAQDAVVEWMEFDCEDGPCLLLNAYRTEKGAAAPEATREGPRNDLARAVPASQIAPVRVPLPILTTPGSAGLRSFLRILGASDLDDLAARAPYVLQDAPGTSSFARWSALVRQLRDSSDLVVGETVVRSRMVDSRLQEIYAVQGLPTSADPIFPHLVRGVVSVVEEEGHVPDSLPVMQMGTLEFGQPHYRAARFANLGVRPARLFDSSHLFSAGAISDAAFSLKPGEEASRLLRFEPGFLSLLTGRSSAEISYESMGTRRVVVRLQGSHASWGPALLVSSARARIDTHSGYWNELPLYRNTVIVVFLGLLALAVGGLLRGRAHVAEILRRLSTMPRWLVDTVRRIRSAALPRPLIQVRSRGVGLSVPTFARSFGRSFIRSFAQPFGKSFGRSIARLDVERYHKWVSERFRHGVSDRFRQWVAELLPQLSTTAAGIAGRVHEHVSTGSSRFFAARTVNVAPVSASECVERFRALAKELETDGVDADSAAIMATIRRDAAIYVRRFDADLQNARLAPAVEHFQLLWALRLLVAVLENDPPDFETVLDRWLSGVEKVVEQRCPSGVGPTSWEFMSLVQSLEH